MNHGATHQCRKQHLADSLLLRDREYRYTDERLHQENVENTARRNRTGETVQKRLHEEESKMTTWEEYKAKALQDPELKREYDALEGWYQAELARQETRDRAEKEERRRASMPPTAPHSAFA